MIALTEEIQVEEASDILELIRFDPQESGTLQYKLGQETIDECYRESRQVYERERAKGTKDDIGEDKAIEFDAVGRMFERIVLNVLGSIGLKAEVTPDTYDTYDIRVGNVFIDCKVATLSDPPKQTANFRRKKYLKIQQKLKEGVQIATHVVVGRQLSRNTFEIVHVLPLEDVLAHGLFDDDYEFYFKDRYYKIPFEFCQNGNCHWVASGHHLTKYRPVRFRDFVRNLFEEAKKPILTDLIRISKDSFLTVKVWKDEVGLRRVTRDSRGYYK